MDYFFRLDFLQFSICTHSNALCEAWADDVVDVHSDVGALKGGSCCFCSSLGEDL